MVDEAEATDIQKPEAENVGVKRPQGHPPGQPAPWTKTEENRQKMSEGRLESKDLGHIQVFLCAWCGSPFEEYASKRKSKVRLCSETCRRERFGHEAKKRAKARTKKQHI